MAGGKPISADSGTLTCVLSICLFVMIELKIVKTCNCYELRYCGCVRVKGVFDFQVLFGHLNIIRMS